MLKVAGMDELQNQLDCLAKKAEELDGIHNVPLNDLLSSEFVSSNTKFSSADEMFEASGFKIESQHDFTAIPDTEWDEFIRSISSFADWQAMLGEACSVWMAEKVGF
jgi:hypothetical protein